MTGFDDLALNIFLIPTVFIFMQSSRKRLIGRIFTHTFAVLRQINPGLDSPLRLFFIVTTVIKDQCSE